jgi:glycosyltransferase 2 family protein
MIRAHHSQQGSRAWLLIALRWVAGFAILGVLLRFLPWAPLRAAISQVPVSRFALVLAGYLLAHSLGVAKWRMVVNAAGAELDYATCAQCYAGGLFGTLFLPSIVGGDVIRLAVGLRRSPRPAAVLAGNVVDRFLDVAAQGGLVLMGLVLLPNAVPEKFAKMVESGLLWAAGGVVLLFVSGMVFRRRLLGGRSVRFRRRLARLRHAVQAVSRRRHVLALGWLVGTLIQTTFLILTARLAIYCGLVLPLKVWLFAWPLAKLAAVMPLTQGGIGVREAALVGLLAPFGAPGHLVLAAGLIWEGVIVAGGLIAGAVALVLRRERGASRAAT